MHTFTALFPLCLLLSGAARGLSFDEFQADTGELLDLLGKQGANNMLINNVVDCLGKTVDASGKSADFLRCVNSRLHTDDQTRADDVRFILGNYAARSSAMLINCFKDGGDLVHCLRAFGECIPAMLRGAFGYDQSAFNCKRLVKIPGYDREESYLKDEEAGDDLGSDFDDLEGYDGYDYDDYDYDYDEYGGYDDYDFDEDEKEEFDGMLSESKAEEPSRRSSVSSGPSIVTIEDPETVDPEFYRNLVEQIEKDSCNIN